MPQRADIEQAIANIEECRAIHTLWIETKVKRRIGSRAWHRAWVAKYDLVLKVLRAEGAA